MAHRVLKYTSPFSQSCGMVAIWASCEARLGSTLQRHDRRQPLKLTKEEVTRTKLVDPQTAIRKEEREAWLKQRGSAASMTTIRRMSSTQPIVSRYHFMRYVIDKYMIAYHQQSPHTPCCPQPTTASHCWQIKRGRGADRLFLHADVVLYQLLILSRLHICYGIG